MDAFQQRVAHVFAALGADMPSSTSAAPPPCAGEQHERPADFAADAVGSAPPPPGGVPWQLVTNQGFKAGRGADASDEDEDGVPESLPGAGGSDDDEQQYARNASAAFCRAFEREAELDEFDAMAVQGMAMRPHGAAAAAARPPRSTEVVDDNAFDRLCELRQPSGIAAGKPGPAAGGDAAGSDGGGKYKRPYGDPSGPAPIDSDGGAGSGGGGGGGGGGRNAETSSAGPNGRRPEATAEAAGAPSSDDKPTRGGRRVTFDLPPRAATGAAPSGSGGAVAIPDGGHGRGGRGWGGSGGGGRRDRGGRAVPDHVLHPERYTVYMLDEPLYVGQGDAGRGAGRRDNADNERAARSTQEAVALAAPGGDGPSVHDPERFRGEFGAGGIRFQPTAKRQKGDPSQGSASMASCAARAATSHRDNAKDDGGGGGGGTDAAMMVAEGAGVPPAGGLRLQVRGQQPRLAPGHGAMEVDDGEEAEAGGGGGSGPAPAGRAVPRAAKGVQRRNCRAKPADDGE